MLEFNETKGFRCVDDYVVCRKLCDAGVEIIVVNPTIIEFEWGEYICSYKNRTFYCGSERIKQCDNIYKLDSNFLNELVGKLTDEQLDRLGNVIDLYDDTIKHLESQLDDMKSVGMSESDLYFIKEEEYRKHTEFVAMLRTAFETRDFDTRDFEDYKYVVPVVNYVLKVE